MDIVKYKNYQLPEHDFSGKSRAKTSLRMTYEAQAEVIKGQTGELEDIRLRLGLSARKMAQLLLVDPSAWTRWTKQGDQPPLLIWRALQWYLRLHEQNPEQFTLRKVEEFESLRLENQRLAKKIEILEHGVRANRITAILIGISSLILAFAFYRLMKS
jgi:hypothetical protein